MSEELKYISTGGAHISSEVEATKGINMTDVNVVFSTPQVIRRKVDSQNSAVSTVLSSYSVDSGFSERTIDSGWTSSLSLQSSPESEDLYQRRQTLKASEYSPIKRDTLSCIPGRRLTFISVAESTDSCLAEEYVLEPKIQECETTPQTVDSVGNQQDDSVLALKSSPKACYHLDLNARSDAEVTNTDSLEFDFQEMVIGESPKTKVESRPFSIHLVRSSICDSIENTYSRDRNMRWSWPSTERSQPSIGSDEFLQHIPWPSSGSLHKMCSCPTSKHGTAEFDVLNQSQSRNTAHKTSPSKEDVKQSLLTKFSLTPPGRHGLPSSSCKLQLEPSPPSHQATYSDSDQLHGSVLTKDQHSCARVPHLKDLSRPPVPTCQSEAISNQLDMPNIPSQYTFQYNQHLLTRHPRTLFKKSPVKRQRDCTGDYDSISSPTKVRKTELELGNSVARLMNLSPSKESPRAVLSSDGDSAECGCSLTSRNDSSPLHVGYQLKARQVEAVFKDMFTDSVDVTSHSWSVLNKVICQCSPEEPARLIGRNVGVKRFDILGELYVQNFHVCWVKILQFLPGADLVSVASVSSWWAQMVQSDHKVYSRCRQWRKSLARPSTQTAHGKENCGQKLLDDESSQHLTQSRGFLSSVQSQANAKKPSVPELQPAVSVKDNLLAEDKLRTCPRCREPAVIREGQDRASCMNDKCGYDFCTLCFSSFHHPQACKPLCRAPSKGDVAGTKKSRKNLKRL